MGRPNHANKYIVKHRNNQLHSLSMPSARGLWKNKATNVVYVVIKSGPFGLLVRPQNELDSEPMKVDNILNFYDEFTYMGKEA